MKKQSKQCFLFSISCSKRSLHSRYDGLPKADETQPDTIKNYFHDPMPTEPNVPLISGQSTVKYEPYPKLRNS